ncbi:MAG: hypothetical protein HYX90_02745 [Chloroflexi bacterium]|nr:hypothetical protein [Chloroflexota bacterium]
MTTQPLNVSAKRVLDELKKCRVSHIVWLPDSEARFMHDAMMNQHDMTLVPVCREGEAIAVAVGLTLGGQRPVVLHQNTGFFESGDSVRGLGLDLKLPLLLLIGYRGWHPDTPLTDSRAVFTKPILRAWGVKHHIVETDQHVKRISAAYKETQDTKRPVAILIGTEYR